MTLPTRSISSATWWCLILKGGRMFQQHPNKLPRRYIGLLPTSNATRPSAPHQHIGETQTALTWEEGRSDAEEGGEFMGPVRKI